MFVSQDGCVCLCLSKDVFFKGCLCLRKVVRLSLKMVGCLCLVCKNGCVCLFLFVRMFVCYV